MTIKHERYTDNGFATAPLAVIFEHNVTLPLGAVVFAAASMS
jgi:hypothetical protein